jgi:hypothetical protein
LYKKEKVPLKTLNPELKEYYNFFLKKDPLPNNTTINPRPQAAPKQSHQAPVQPNTTNINSQSTKNTTQTPTQQDNETSHLNKNSITPKTILPSNLQNKSANQSPVLSKNTSINSIKSQQSNKLPLIVNISTNPNNKTANVCINLNNKALNNLQSTNSQNTAINSTTNGKPTTKYNMPLKADIRINTDEIRKPIQFQPEAVNKQSLANEKPKIAPKPKITPAQTAQPNPHKINTSSETSKPQPFVVVQARPITVQMVKQKSNDSNNNSSSFASNRSKTKYHTLNPSKNSSTSLSSSAAAVTNKDGKSSLRERKMSESENSNSSASKNSYDLKIISEFKREFKRSSNDISYISKSINTLDNILNNPELGSENLMSHYQRSSLSQSDLRLNNKNRNTSENSSFSSKLDFNRFNVFSSHHGGEITTCATEDQTFEGATSFSDQTEGKNLFNFEFDNYQTIDDRPCSSSYSSSGGRIGIDLIDSRGNFLNIKNYQKNSTTFSSSNNADNRITKQLMNEINHDKIMRNFNNPLIKNLIEQVAQQENEHVQQQQHQQQQQVPRIIIQDAMMFSESSNLNENSTTSSSSSSPSTSNDRNFNDDDYNEYDNNNNNIRQRMPSTTSDDNLRSSSMSTVITTHDVSSRPYAFEHASRRNKFIQQMPRVLNNNVNQPIRQSNVVINRNLNEDNR